MTTREFRTPTIADELPAPKSRRTDRLAREVARLASSRAKIGQIQVTDPIGEWSIGPAAPPVVVKVHDLGAYADTVRRTSVGLGESYVAGRWDTDDLTGLLRLVIKNMERPLGLLDRGVHSLRGPLSAWHRRRPPTPARDRRNVRAHYDLPPELFGIMLDESMLYSCAIFETPQATLAQAQFAKLERICDSLDLGPDDHLLEIGTGWGGLAIHAATTRGCRVTTTTISREQRQAARARVEAAGCSDVVEVLGLDYRELTGSYTKLASIEMIEAVDWRLHDVFFATCRDRLVPGGRMLLQAIVIEDASYERAKFRQDFIRALVFPGGCLPSRASIATSVERSKDLAIIDVNDVGLHYATTLRRWHEAFEEGWPAVAPSGFGEEFHRLWRLYLCYCEAAFLERHISDVQVLIERRR